MTPQELERHNRKMRERLAHLIENEPVMGASGEMQVVRMPRTLPPKPPPGDALGWLLPYSPTTWEDEMGMPESVSKWDAESRTYTFFHSVPTGVGSIGVGWDDEHMCWVEFQRVWDGAVPEEARFGTPGHSKGMLLEFYPTSSIIRGARLVTTRDTTMPLNPVVPKKKRKGGPHECES